MGFSNQERLNFNSKVLTANIQDNIPVKQWYESIRPNFFILEDGQILTEFSVVRGYPAANLSTARNNVSNHLVGIVEDLSQFSNAVRLTPDIASNGFQYIALTTYNDFSSARLDKWVQPQKVPQSNSQPSIGYSVQLYDGDPASGGTLINTSDGQTGSGNTASVGWIFNYDTGTLLLSEDFKDSISDPYIVGFRYIGETVADIEGGAGATDTQRYFYTTTQTSHGYPIGSQYVPVYKDDALNWVEARGNHVNTLAAGFITNAIDTDTLEITFGGRVTVSGHALLEREYYFLDVDNAGEITSDMPISGVVQPVLYVEDEDHILINLQRPNELTEEPPEVISRIQGLEISVSGLEDDFTDLEGRTSDLESNSAQGSGSPQQVAVWSDTNVVSGYDNLQWNPSTDILIINGDIVITGTVDGRNLSTDGSNLDTHIANSSLHFTEGSISHTNIQNIGINTHAQIDTHIWDNSVHFHEGDIDHGTISGLNDDDHPHYLRTDGTRVLTGNLDLGSNSIVNITNVDGRDVSVDGTVLDSHVTNSGIHPSDASELQMGTPTDGSYTGLLEIQTSDQVNDVLDQINDVLDLIAPAAPGGLTSQDLTLSITSYSAKLPAGLSANWGSYVPGNTITGLVITNTYSLSSPNASTRFNAGLTSGDGGTVTHVLNSVDGNSRAVSSGVGSTGTIQITDISTYNSIWNKVNAQINRTQPSEGKEEHALKHTLAGTSDTTTIYYDDINTAPSFSVSPTAVISTQVLKYLSGISYYTTGTDFLISYTAAAGIFRKAYHATQVSRISCTGMTNLTVNPGSVPNVNDTFVVTNQLVTFTVANQSNLSPYFTVTLRKPNGTSVSSNTAVLSKKICTYGTQSTTTYDNFVDEAQRLVLSTDTSWTSSNALIDGNAQVRCGTLQYPNATDYPGFSGDQIYERKIVKASASSGTIVFAGLASYTNISQYNSGDLNVFLHLETDDIWFDLGRSFGSNNGDGSGDSIVNSKGALNSGGSSGTSLAFTFGTYNTANNNNRYRIRIVFRNSTRSLTSITAS